MNKFFRDPSAETSSILRSRKAPLKTLSDKVIALMDIGKMRGDEYIDRLESLCNERGINTRRFKKPTNTRVAPKHMIDEITKTCDAVIIALSDCGSCTSCSTHDLNDLDKNGIPGVSVLTEEFRKAFQSQKQAIGLDAASIYVPHPMQNKTTEEFSKKINDAINSVADSQNKASKITKDYELGKETDLTKVIMQQQISNIAFQMTLNVRNKVLSSYKDIMNMPV